MRAFLLPDAALSVMRIAQRTPLRQGANTVYRRATFENGSVLWTSPEHLLRRRAGRRLPPHWLCLPQAPERRRVGPRDRSP
jgi:hypothetical protein